MGSNSYEGPIQQALDAHRTRQNASLRGLADKVDVAESTLIDRASGIPSKKTISQIDNLLRRVLADTDVVPCDT